MPPSPRVLVVGDVVNDTVAKTAAPLVPDADNPAMIRARPGGSAANQAAWMARLGLNVVFAGRAGAADAAFHRRELARFGVEPRLAADESAPTGAIVVLVGPDGERTMITDRGANLRLGPGDVPPALLDDVALLHLTGYSFFAPGPRAAVHGLISEASRRGVPFTVDPGSAAFLRQLEPGAFLGWTEGAAVCFPNRDEAAVLAGPAVPGGAMAPAGPGGGRDEPAALVGPAVPGGPAPASAGTGGGRDEAAVLAGPAVPEGPTRRPADLGRDDPRLTAAALARNYGAVVLKLGADGAVLAVAGSPPILIPAWPATVRDTTGAGDAFCAGFLAAWLAGAPLAEAGTAAAKAAALAVATFGGRPDTPAA
jgi:sugar/nucleoside kinase (ribokinase family)